VNSKENPEIRERFPCAGIPTVILFGPSGVEIDRSLGYVGTDEFITKMDNYQNGVGTLADLMRQEAERNDDPEFMDRLGWKLYEHRKFAEADARYAKVVQMDSANAMGLASKAQMQRANMAGRDEDYALATAMVDAIRKRWPDSEETPEAVIYVGYYSKKAEKHEAARAAFEEYLETWPEGKDASYAQKQIQVIDSILNAQ